MPGMSAQKKVTKKALSWRSALAPEFILPTELADQDQAISLISLMVSK
jgi:hypothetical protein